MADRSEIDLVRDRADILQVIAPYVALKRSGRVWKGLCPFHNEKTPSFHVNPDMKVWRCFGQCGEGGDVFKFLEKAENLSFPEALERVALQAGVALTPFKAAAGSGRPARESSERDRLYAAVEQAARFYAETLERSEPALSYLEARGIARPTQQDFRLGFAGDDWAALPQWLLRHDVSLSDGVAAGVVSASEKGGHNRQAGNALHPADVYDRLRGRIIFPILDSQERVVAFGGRLMEAAEGRPKYLNSAETPLFTKGRMLYGLWRARKAIAAAEQAIIVEGYMDVIATHQAGFENVVAALGTSLTEQHAQIISRFARSVVLSFDADAAGIKAARRAAQIFAAQEIDALMLDLPDGEDPDSLVRAGRSSDFARAIAGALPVAEHQLRKIVARPGLTTAPERAKMEVLRREVWPILRSTKSPIERQRYFRICGPLHPLFADGDPHAEEQILREIEGSARASSSPAGYAQRPQSSWSSGARYRRGGSYPASAGGRSGEGWPPARDSWNNTGREYGAQNRKWRPAERSTAPAGPIAIEARSAEEILLRAALMEPDEARRRIGAEIGAGDFPTPGYRALARRLLGEAEPDLSPDIADFADSPGEDLDSLSARLLIVGPPTGAAGAEDGAGAQIDWKAVEDSIARLKGFSLKQRAAELRHRAIDGDRAATAELLRLQQQQRQ